VDFVFWSKTTTTATMLLSKTSTKIKDYLSHRRKRSADGDEEPFESHDKSTNRTSRTKSWISQARPSIDRSASLRRVASSATSRAHPPSLPTNPKTAHSSVSSLCSCCNVSLLNENSLSKALRSPSTPEVLCSATENDISIFSDTISWKQLISEPSNAVSGCCKLTGSNPETATSSTFDLFEALNMVPVDGDTTPTQATRAMDPANPNEPWSDNVERLIRETDEAFKAVGFALADAKAASAEWIPNDDPSLSQSSRRGSPRNILRKQHKAPVTRNISASKPKINRSKTKKHIRGTGRPKLPVYSVRSPSSRWTLTEMTEGMADIFTNKIFNRVEVDEILTPGRVLQLQMENHPHCRDSGESIRSNMTDETSTRSDPFNLEDIPSRIAAAGVEDISSTPPRLNSPELSPNLCTTPLSNQNARHSICIVNPTIHDSSSFTEPMALIPEPATPTSLQFHNLNFPSPPDAVSPPRLPSQQTSPHLPQRTRSSAGSRRGPPTSLPTIPEISPIVAKLVKESVSSEKGKGKRATTFVDSCTLSCNPSLEKSGSPKSMSRCPPKAICVVGFKNTFSDTGDGLRIAHKALNEKFDDIDKIEGVAAMVNVRDDKLTSTPYTLTSPTFRHGSIRLIPSPPVSSKTHLTPSYSSSSSSRSRSSSNSDCEDTLDPYHRQLKSPPKTKTKTKTKTETTRLSQHNQEDENQISKDRKKNKDVVDWTAFQIAISGGSGDYLMDSVYGYGFYEDVERAREETEREIQDLESWWSGFGLELGTFRTMDEEKTRRCGNGFEKGGSEKAGGIEADVELVTHQPSHMASLWTTMITKDMAVLHNQVLLTDRNCREIRSLPPSPMQEFNLSTEIVPMGFNLSHDIGDFLTWKAAHVRGEEDVAVAGTWTKENVEKGFLEEVNTGKEA
jgi:hypothetical protein